MALVAHGQTKGPARPDAARGQQIASQVCVTCHNTDGNSTLPGNPRLAQQHADYLYKQLVDYTPQGQAKPARENPIMNGFAAQLSDADKRNVAAWFASQAAKPGSAKNPRGTLCLLGRLGYYREIVSGSKPTEARLDRKDAGYLMDLRYIGTHLYACGGQNQVHRQVGKRWERVHATPERRACRRAAPAPARYRPGAPAVPTGTATRAR